MIKKKPATVVSVQRRKIRTNKTTTNNAIASNKKSRLIRLSGGKKKNGIGALKGRNLGEALPCEGWVGPVQKKRV